MTDEMRQQEHSSSEQPSSPEIDLSSQSIGLRIQKKLASKMSSKGVAKMFVDEQNSRILDNLHELVELYTGERKLADKMLNDVIKTIVKVGLLYRNNRLSEAELELCRDFSDTFHYFVKSALSFYEIDYSFEYAHLYQLLRNCQNIVQSIVRAHLTDKSKTRIDVIFDFFVDKTFLEHIFRNDACKPTMCKIVDDVRTLLDSGLI